MPPSENACIRFSRENSSVLSAGDHPGREKVEHRLGQKALARVLHHDVAPCRLLKRFLSGQESAGRARIAAPPRERAIQRICFGVFEM